MRRDGLEEVELGKASIGTTGKGIGPTYSTKMSRSGIRIADIYDSNMLDTKVRHMAAGFKKRFGDLLQYDVEDELAKLKSYSEKLAPYIVDEVPLIRSAKDQKAQILVEGAQATMLDIDHGTYPFVTSSNCGLGGILTGTSLGWSYLKEVVGVVKAYTTRVGSGPFPTELLNDTGEKLQQIGREVGVTTGRKRRCGALDLFLVKYSHEVNDYTSLNLTKLDVLDEFEELQVGIGYEIPGDGKMQPLESFPASVKTLESVKVVYKTMKGWKSNTTGIKSYADLPNEAKEYIEFIEQYVGVPVKWIGTGPKREDTIIR